MRRWVFPVLRIVLVAAIAVALVKLAFFPSGESTAADPATPTGQLTDPVTTVTTGTIVNDVTVTGSIVADDAVPARATAAGTVNKVQATVGKPIDVGAVLFDIKVETPRDPVVETGPDGTQTMTERKPAISYTEVTAPISGVVSELPVLAGQSVSIGDAVGSVAPPTFSVSATLPAEQQYRLIHRPTEATVTVKGGPAPFTCTGLTITTPPASAANTAPNTVPGTGGGGGGSGGGSTTTVRCAVPAEVTVFAGLSADVTISAGRAENVLTVPTTAVKGSAEKGVVYVPDGKGGDPAQVEVALGLTDGTSVEVTGGLKEGDSVLQFVPGATTPEGGCVPMGNGGMMCSGPGPEAGP
ncbi:efflux RND transporter periplasmic adaptor subunit [Leifsonia shinshuensis]|uniref:HlyD family efflux transporter periplasmic adaptor subunit n=1 Tax=Leifsonia shinshuensis TaxID=150026 RepID=A0A7G6Y5T1_9MICO|nr:efflux RND transporter periplasmic adaptor subunit [Leifsonia shinshuensis]QNE33846.1 HlyD family efflux transporter periplasmic adaptor subunit [Leifsonia shinshuensis]